MPPTNSPGRVSTRVFWALLVRSRNGRASVGNPSVANTGGFWIVLVGRMKKFPSMPTVWLGESHTPPRMRTPEKLLYLNVSPPRTTWLFGSVKRPKVLPGATVASGVRFGPCLTHHSRYSAPIQQVGPQTSAWPSIVPAGRCGSPTGTGPGIAPGGGPGIGPGTGPGGGR